MSLRNLTGGARWDKATGWPDQYAPPKPGNGIGGDPCPCERPHGLLYRDPACDAADRRAALVRRAAIESSTERPAWLERWQDAAARRGREIAAAVDRADRELQRFADAIAGAATPEPEPAE
jgi:hypothetical protein